ncbi:hypothetical protein UFOVP62_39 [uncultured Caudovirales phage]|uniref:Uncharacterized protein n=1 Tax=uncultured Caudovirales phage TaxID=2100421 RepID=A0A6J5KQY4_9CAUD|nr:hypothetical protein UFOVP62_39 [uncultured Caudovirales phage]
MMQSTEIINRLQAVNRVYDDQPGARLVPVNPDGPDAARYIDQLRQTIGWLVHDAYKHVQDEDALRQMVLRARDAMEGVQ